MIKEIFTTGSSARNVGILVSGTAMAQAIPVAITPILTRLYAPADFGLVAIYLSCATVLSVLATGRYEQAVTLPKSDEDAANIAIFAVRICFIVCVLLVFPVVLYGGQVAIFLGNKDVAPWLYLLPISVFLMGVWNVLELWLNRTSQYTMMSKARLANSASASAASLFLGLGGVNSGQIWGALVGPSLSCILALRKIMRDQRVSILQTSYNRQLCMAYLYRRHSKYLMASQLVGTIATQLPIMLIGGMYSLGVVGYFSLAFRLVSMPTSMIAGAIGDVYRQRIADEYHVSGNFSRIFLKTVRITSLTAFFPCIAMYLAAPDLFSLLLGEGWREAGEYARILVVAAFFQFAFTPVDKGAVLVGAVRYIMLWHCARLLLLVGIFVSATQNNFNIETVIWLLVAANSILYIVDGYVEFTLAKRGING